MALPVIWRTVLLSVSKRLPRDLHTVLPISLIFSILLDTNCATKFPMTVYADELCFHGVFRVLNDIIVMVSKGRTLPPNTKCTVQLMSYSGSSLVASVRSYHMEDSYTHSLDCQYESINLGSMVNPHLLGPLGYCKSSRPTDQYYLGETGTFGYTAGPYSPLATPFVELLVSEVFVKNASEGCRDGYFDCGHDNMCINDQLTCNGYNDCGNNRDEEDDCKMSPGVIAGIVTGGVIFILIIVVLAALHVKYRKMRSGYIQH